MIVRPLEINLVLFASIDSVVATRKVRLSLNMCCCVLWKCRTYTEMSVTRMISSASIFVHKYGCYRCPDLESVAELLFGLLSFFTLAVYGRLFIQPLLFKYACILRSAFTWAFLSEKLHCGPVGLSVCNATPVEMPRLGSN